jgi:putative oxidoreductase
MTEDRLRSYGVFLLRVALGTMFIAHSMIYMLMTLTLAGTAKFFVSIGLPAWLAYVTILAEAIGGILLILGVQTRWVALALMEQSAPANVSIMAGDTKSYLKCGPRFGSLAVRAFPPRGGSTSTRR